MHQFLFLNIHESVCIVHQTFLIFFQRFEIKFKHRYIKRSLECFHIQKAITKMLLFNLLKKVIIICYELPQKYIHVHDSINSFHFKRCNIACPHLIRTCMCMIYETQLNLLVQRQFLHELLIFSKDNSTRVTYYTYYTTKSSSYSNDIVHRN